MAQKRISLTLNSVDGRICCSHCQHALCSAHEDWKMRAVLSELPVAGLPNEGLGVGPNVMLRRFGCPECGSLLDTEIALAGDPFLLDRVSHKG